MEPSIGSRGTGAGERVSVVGGTGKTGRAVRAGILGEDYGRTLVAVLLPFPILFGVVAAIHFGGPGVPGAKHGGRRTTRPAGGARHE